MSTLLVVTTLFALLAFYLFKSYPLPRKASKSEGFFMDPKSGKIVKFGSIKDIPSVKLSIVIPAYNEQDRLPLMLKETLDYLDQRLKDDCNFSVEIIVVDDGSKDKTTQVALQIAKKQNYDKRKSIRVMTLIRNRGKGGAVAQGILVARGEVVLFADADGATEFKDIETLETKLNSITNDGLGMVVGSRSHMVKTDAVIKVIMYNFRGHLSATF